MTKLQEFRQAVEAAEYSKVGDLFDNEWNRIMVKYDQLSASDRLLALSHMRINMQQGVENSDIAAASFWLRAQEHCVGGER
jgi:hypothetical protein